MWCGGAGGVKISVTLWVPRQNTGVYRLQFWHGTEAATALCDRGEGGSVICQTAAALTFFAHGCCRIFHIWQTAQIVPLWGCVILAAWSFAAPYFVSFAALCFGTFPAPYFGTFAVRTFAAPQNLMGWGGLQCIGYGHGREGWQGGRWGGRHGVGHEGLGD